jgi:hypothetical protein
VDVVDVAVDVVDVDVVVDVVVVDVVELAQRSERKKTKSFEPTLNKSRDLWLISCLRCTASSTTTTTSMHHDTTTTATVTTTTTTATTTLITTVDGKPPRGVFFLFFIIMLYLFFVLGMTVDYYLDPFNDHDDGHDDHTPTSPILQPTPKPLTFLKERWQQQQQQQRLETCRISSRWYVFIFFIYYTNVYLGPPNTSNGDGSGNSSKGSRRVASRASGKFIFYLFIYYTNVFFSRPLNVSKRRWQQEQQWLERCGTSWMPVFFFLYYLFF